MSPGDTNVGVARVDVFKVMRLDEITWRVSMVRREKLVVRRKTKKQPAKVRRGTKRLECKCGKCLRSRM